MSNALKKAVLKCKSVLSLPAIYQKISLKIEQPQTTNNELAEVVKLDPGVSCKLLAIVNSSFYGFPSQISSISHAISLVGLNDFKNLVLSSSVVKLYDEVKHTEFSIRAFWDHSLLCAILARRLGNHWGTRNDQETLFIAGLLHDVGKLVMLEACKENQSALSDCWDRLDLQAEATLVGFDHAQAGSALIATWGLPALLVDSTAQHHALSKEPDAVAVCVYLANATISLEGDALESVLEHCNRYTEQPLTMDELLEIRDQAIGEKDTLIGIYLS